MPHTLPVTKARNQLLRLVDKVSDDYTRIDFTKNGVTKASLVSPQYLNALEETVFSAKYSIKDIQKAEFDLVKGAYQTLQQLTKKVTSMKISNNHNPSNKQFPITK